MAKQEQKDIKQRIEQGEFAQSAEISASYLDEDILIIDNIKVLANPDPVRLQMNMIASCQKGNLKMEVMVRRWKWAKTISSFVRLILLWISLSFHRISPVWRSVSPTMVCRISCDHISMCGIAPCMWTRFLSSG